MSQIFSKLLFGLACCVVGLAALVTVAWFCCVFIYPATWSVSGFKMQAGAIGVGSFVFSVLPSGLMYLLTRAPRDRKSFLMSAGAVVLIAIEIGTLYRIPLILHSLGG
jgi:hypothetical protein